MSSYYALEHAYTFSHWIPPTQQKSQGRWHRSHCTHVDINAQGVQMSAPKSERQDGDQASHRPRLPHASSARKAGAECHWGGATRTWALLPQATPPSCFLTFSPLSFYFFKYELKSHLCPTQKPSLAFPAHTDLSDLFSWLKEPTPHYTIQLFLLPCFVLFAAYVGGIWGEGINIR